MIARGVAGIIALLLLWEAITRGLALPAYTLPAPSAIISGVWSDRAILAPAAVTTGLEAILGYLLGGAIGVTLAALLTVVAPLRSLVLPTATAINAVPVVAWSPVVLLWFGLGIRSKIVMVALAVGFTVFLSALSGFDRVDRRAADLLRSFGAGRAAILWRLRLPAALPLIAAGLRVATVRSVIVAIVTEMLGAYSGLGWVVYQAVVQIDFVQVWGAVFVASVGSLVFFGVISAVEKKVIFWK